MPDNFVCGKCGKVAKTKQALERHAAYHEDDRPFSCEVCLQRFKNSDDRGKHYRRLKRDGKFEIACKACHKHFKTVDLLDKHVEMLGCKVAAELGGLPTDSDTGMDINDATNTKTDFTVSVKEESLPGDGVHCTCKICEAEFVGSSFLKAHYKDLHNDTKKQVCIQCGQTLSSKDSLARHFSIFHQTSFPYMCNTCNQKFKIKESLCRHIKFVHQNSGYPCTECHRVFTQPVNLKKHMAVHSPQKEYACQVCGREFRWKQALQKHEALHSEKNGDKCITNEANSEIMENESDIIEELNESEEDDQCDETGIKLEVVSQIDASEFESEICNESDELIYSDGGISNSKQTNELLSNTECETTTGVKYICKSVQKDELPEKRQIAKKIGNIYVLSSDDDSELDEQDIQIGTDSGKSLVRKRKGFTKDYELEASDKKMKLAEAESTHTIDTNELPTTVSAEVNAEVNSAVNQSDEIENCENIKCVTDASYRLQQVKYSALTSCPTSKTDHFPRFVFKPSSIQNLMSKSNKQTEIVNDIDIETNSENATVGVQKPSKSFMKFPNNIGTLGQSLHNPFLIQDSRKSSDQMTSSLINTLPRKKYFINRENGMDSVNSDSKSPTTTIPSGKFSMVKHMLSLKNEENFDKTVFENPLYNTLPEVKDLKLLVERHKITHKTDDCIVEKYDLSAKQNIPFHWLGMSVPKKKIETDVFSKKINMTSSIKMSDNVCNNVVEKPVEVKEGRSMIVSHNKQNDVVVEKTAVMTNSNKSDQRCAIEKVRLVKEHGQDPRGFQAIRSLVALKKRSGGDVELINNSNSGYSVLSNPFVKQTNTKPGYMEAEKSANNDTSTAAEHANMLKRSTDIFVGMSRMHNSAPELANDQPTWNGNPRIRDENDHHFECNSDLNGTYSRFLPDKRSQNALSAESSLVTQRCSSSVKSSVSMHTSSHISSRSAIQDSFVQFNRSTSIPTCSSSNVSSVLPRYGSDSVLSTLSRSLYIENSQGFTISDHSFEGLTSHSMGKRENLLGLSHGLNGSNISNNIQVPHSPKDVGMRTSWSLPRPISQTENHLHHPAVSVHGDVTDKHYAHFQNVNKDIPETYRSKIFSENEGHVQLIPASSSHENISHSKSVKSNVNVQSASDLFSAVEMSQPVISSKFQPHGDGQCLKSPMYGLPHATSHQPRNKMSDYETENQKREFVPTIHDFSFKCNDESVHVKTNVPSLDGANFGRANLNEVLPSPAHAGVSIFDILKGPTEKPKQLENVDYLLNAYV